MKLSFWLNGVYRHDDVEPDTLLLEDRKSTRLNSSH